MSLAVEQPSAAVERDRVATMQLRALAHPIRLRIMSLLTAAPMTAAEIARELSMNHANASYHLRQLHAAGAIVIDSEEHIRGGVAKRYRYEQPVDGGPTPDTAVSADQLAQRRSLYNAMSLELRRRGQYLRQGEHRGHMTDAELWVDPEVWEDARAKVHEASLALHRMAQPPRTPGTIRVNATIALFEMQPTEMQPTEMKEN